MVPSTKRGFAALLPSLALIATVFALSACELAYHELSAERQAGCDPWRVGCRPAIDVAGEGPIQPTVYDVERQQIVGDAERTPYGECDTFPVGCQFITSGHVLEEQYF